MPSPQFEPHPSTLAAANASAAAAIRFMGTHAESKAHTCLMVAGVGQNRSSELRPRTAAVRSRGRLRAGLYTDPTSRRQVSKIPDRLGRAMAVVDENPRNRVDRWLGWDGHGVC